MKVLCINDEFRSVTRLKWRPKKGRVYTISLLGPDLLTLLEDADRGYPGEDCNTNVCWPDGRWPFYASRFVEVDDSVRHLTVAERLEAIDASVVEDWVDMWRKLAEGAE